MDKGLDDVIGEQGVLILNFIRREDLISKK